MTEQSVHFVAVTKKEILDSDKTSLLQSLGVTIAHDKFENDILTEIKCKIRLIYLYNYR